MKYENTLIAFQEDIQTRGAGDWLRAHTSFLKPLYAAQGTLHLDGRRLSFSGRSRDGQRSVTLAIHLRKLEDVHLGFDRIFRRREDRQMGLFGFKPLRIRFRETSRERILYLFAGYHLGLLGWRACHNADLYRRLLRNRRDFGLERGPLESTNS